MNGLVVSNFKRIHRGLLLDLLLLFLVPGVVCVLLALIARQVAAAGMDEATVGVLLRSPTVAVRALYSFLVLQYCAKGLCALLVVSGIGEPETGSGRLQHSKRAFLALTITYAVAMLTHICSVLIPGNEQSRLISVAFLTAIMMILLLRAIALRSLMQGCGKVMDSIGAQALATRAFVLGRHITASIALLLGCLLASLILGLMGIRPLPRLLLIGAGLALAYYVVIFILVIRCIRKASDIIAAISE